MSLALALSLSPGLENREKILTFTFGVVAFSMIVQGLSIKSMIWMAWRFRPQEKTRSIEYAFSKSPLPRRGRSSMKWSRLNLLSTPIYEKLRREFDATLATLSEQISDIYTKDSGCAESEMQTAKIRLMAAEKSSIEEACPRRFDWRLTGARMVDATDSQMDELIARVRKAAE